MKEFFLQDEGIKLHAKLEMPDDVEKCPLVIVVHGFTGHMEEPHILGVANAIREEGFATLRVEMYGHGKSGGQFKYHTLHKWVSNMLKVILYAEKQDFVTDLYLCGHSQGGLLTMLVAGLVPKKLKAIIPMSPAWMIPEEARRGTMLGTMFDPNSIPEEFVQNKEHVLDGGYIRDAQSIHVEPSIFRYQKPVLIIHGSKDETVPYEYGVLASELYKNAKLVTIEGDNHCYDFHLDQVETAIQEFLKEQLP